MAKALSNERIAVAEEAFVRYLRSQQIKYTKPRRAILRAALGLPVHFDAEQLLALLHQAGDRVAKATIYRTLPLLVDSGILKQVRLSDNQAHYEHILEDAPHDHMVCLRCGRIIEFESRRVEQLRDQIARENDFRAVSHRFGISGYCASCAKSRTADELKLGGNRPD